MYMTFVGMYDIIISVLGFGKENRMKKKWNILKCVVFILLGCFSILYSLVCLIYAGRSLSWLWIWPVFAAFCFFRVWILMRIQKGEKVSCPKWISVCYRIAFILGLTIFVVVESMIIGAMHTKPPKDLSYIIVLGAGIHGNQPTRPLLLRMRKATEYMKENENTILIASGGQGSDEEFSEASCIRDYLVQNGIDSERILLEDQSTSTKENIINSFEMIGDTTETVGILSNGFHIYRATLLAKKLGHENVTGISTKTLLPVGLHYVIREFFGVIQLWILGV